MPGKKNPEDTPQFNYRLPGEPETIGDESVEKPRGDVDAMREHIDKEQQRAEKLREYNREGASGGEGLSPNKGQSDPKTQKEIDDMNTGSQAR